MRRADMLRGAMAQARRDVTESLSEVGEAEVSGSDKAGFEVAVSGVEPEEVEERITAAMAGSAMSEPGLVIMPSGSVVQDMPPVEGSELGLE